MTAARVLWTRQGALAESAANASFHEREAWSRCSVVGDLQKIDCFDVILRSIVCIENSLVLLATS